MNKARLFAMAMCSAILCSPLFAETHVYRFSLPIYSHPSKVLPAVLDKSKWLSGYQSLAHISGPRWEVGEVSEISQTVDGVSLVQQEEIIELDWERRLSLKFSNQFESGFAFYELSPTAKGVELNAVFVVTDKVSNASLRQSDVAKRVRFEANLQSLKIEHRKLKKVLELKALREMDAPPH